MENDECTHAQEGMNNFLIFIYLSLEMENGYSLFNESSCTGSLLNNLHGFMIKYVPFLYFPSEALTFALLKQEKSCLHLKSLILNFGPWQIIF